MLSTIRKFMNDESGGMAIEYGLIAGLIAIALVTAFGLLEDEITGLFGRVGTEVKAVVPAG